MSWYFILPIVISGAWLVIGLVSMLVSMDEVGHSRDKAQKFGSRFICSSPIAVVALLYFIIKGLIKAWALADFPSIKLWKPKPEKRYDYHCAKCHEPMDGPHR